MKKSILTLTLLFLISVLFAQNLDGFWGVKWGIGKQEIRTYLASKNIAIAGEDNESIAVVTPFGGKPATISYRFYNNQLYGAMVIYDYVDNLALKNYQSTVAILTEKYGSPTYVESNYESPYYKGDGYEEQAIRLNKGSEFSRWIFKDQNILVCSIGTNLSMSLIYINKELYFQYQAEKDKQTSSDF